MPLPIAPNVDNAPFDCEAPIAVAAATPRSIVVNSACSVNAMPDGEGK